MMFGFGVIGIFLYNVCFFVVFVWMLVGCIVLFVVLNLVVIVVLLLVVVCECLLLLCWVGIVVVLCGVLVVISCGDWLCVLIDFGNMFGVGECFMLCVVLSWVVYIVIGWCVFDGLLLFVVIMYVVFWGFVLLFVVYLFDVMVIGGMLLMW